MGLGELKSNKGDFEGLVSDKLIELTAMTIYTSLGVMDFRVLIVH